MNLYDDVVDDSDGNLLKCVLDNIVVESNCIVVPELWDESVIHEIPNIFLVSK